MRIDQFISQATSYSRKEAKNLIRAKRIAINDVLCTNANSHITEADMITLDGNRLALPGEIYLMLNKPAGYCCSHEDDGYISALKLLPNYPVKLHFAGRLDADTTGLLLISSDGQWCHRVTSPKQRIDKRKEKHYRVELQQALSAEDIQTLQKGVLLHGEDNPTLPAIITRVSEGVYNIAICEGRYHQVKRMFAAVNNKVQSLHRFQIADIMLDENLLAGQFRTLTNNEIKQFSHDA